MLRKTPNRVFPENCPGLYLLDIWGLFGIFGVSPNACLIPLCPLLSMLPKCRVGSSVADVISLPFSPILFIANLTQRSSGKPVEVGFLGGFGILAIWSKANTRRFFESPLLFW